jgi:hypothetical protein
LEVESKAEHEKVPKEEAIVKLLEHWIFNHNQSIVTHT